MSDALHVARNIVNQLGDLWEVPVDVRQATNDDCDVFVRGLILNLVAETLEEARVPFFWDLWNKAVEACYRDERFKHIGPVENLTIFEFKTLVLDVLYAKGDDDV